LIRQSGKFFGLQGLISQLARHSFSPVWLILIACLLALAFGAVWLGFVPPPHASTLVRFHKGSVRVTRGTLRPHAREGVADILSGAQITRAFIAITPGNRVVFSWRIPPAIRQRLRNVLLN
jgi:hypothetical protein